MLPPAVRVRCGSTACSTLAITLNYIPSAAIAEYCELRYRNEQIIAK